MTPARLPPTELIELALEAIGDRDVERLRPLLSPEIRIETERAVHEGVEAALAWAAKGYEHLDRRFVVERLEPVGAGLLGRGRTEYVWRESGALGDATPQLFGFRIRGGLLAGLALYGSEPEAIAALGG